MVKNEEIKQEFALFGAVWKMLKSLLPVGGRHDVEYWDRVNQEVIEIMHQYPGEFGKALALAVLDELERRMKANENQN